MVRLTRSFDAAMGPSMGTEGMPQETFTVPLSMGTGLSSGPSNGLEMA